MFNAIRSLIGNIIVEEENEYIVIKGLPANNIASDIYKYWKTKRIAQYVFANFSAYRVVFPKFFAIEVLYMLEELKVSTKRQVATSTYNKIIEGLKTNTWLKDIEATHPTILNPSKLNLFYKTPLKHQTEFFDLYNDRIPKYDLKGYVLALDTGAGKTLTSLMTLEQLNVDHVVILCPTRALYNVWRKAFETEYKVPQSNWVSRDGGTLPKVAPKGIILHYEYLDKAYDYIVKLGNSGKRVGLIVDESHSFNEVASQRTQMLMRMSKATNFISTLWLSATPIKALGSEMIPMLTTIDPLMTMDSAERFRSIFGKNANKGTDILKNRMGLISFVVKIDKGPVTDITLPVKIPDPRRYLLEVITEDMRKFIQERMDYYNKNFPEFQRTYNEGIAIFEKTLKPNEKEAYNKYKDYFKLICSGYDPKEMMEEAKYCNQYEEKVIAPRLPPKFKNRWKNSRSVIKYVDLKVRGECLGLIVGRRRAEAITAMIPYIGLEDIISKSIKKVVIFTTYVSAVTETQNYLKNKGIESLVVYGEHTKNVSGIVNEFGSNPKYKVLIATMQSLSSAIPLVMANTMVFLNSDFRSINVEQARGRILRINQDTPVEIYECILDTGEKPNIQQRSYDIMEWSKDAVESIMGKSADHYMDISYESLPVDIQQESVSLYLEGLKPKVLKW